MSLNEIFAYVKNTSWADDTDNNAIVKIAEKYCSNISNDFTKRKVIHRICGQSGSGKTTQLCATLLSVYEDQGEKPFVLAVRNFACLHPKYQQFLEKYGKNLIREKTNGFALKCLCVVLSMLLEKQILIILDMTILDPKFEQSILEMISENDYKINYHVFSVHRSISDTFIQKRVEAVIGAEAGRITSKSSSNYFYKILAPALNYLVENYPQHNCVIWNAFDKKPCYCGNLSGCLYEFKTNRKLKKSFMYDENELRKSKIEFYKTHKDFL